MLTASHRRNRTLVARFPRGQVGARNINSTESAPLARHRLMERFRESTRPLGCTPHQAPIEAGARQANQSIGVSIKILLGFGCDRDIEVESVSRLRIESLLGGRGAHARKTNETANPRYNSYHPTAMARAERLPCHAHRLLKHYSCFSPLNRVGCSDAQHRSKSRSYYPVLLLLLENLLEKTTFRHSLRFKKYC